MEDRRALPGEHHQRSAVPTIYAALTQTPVDTDIASLTVAIVGASPLPPSVRTGFEAHTHARIVGGYGLTEATAATTRSFPEHPRAGAVGQRLPYQTVKAADIKPDGIRADLPTGTSGHLLISGPNVFAGYVTGRS